VAKWTQYEIYSWAVHTVSPPLSAASASSLGTNCFTSCRTNWDKCLHLFILLCARYRTKALRTEDLSGPLQRLSGEGVVGNHLVETIHTWHILVVINNACGFGDLLHRAVFLLMTVVVEASCLVEIALTTRLSFQARISTLPLSRAMMSPALILPSTCTNKTLPRWKCMKIPFQLSLPGSRISRSSRWLLRVPTMYAIVVKMLTRGHAVIQIVHVQSMPFRHILWSEQRCYRLFETLRHAVVHVNIPAVLRLGICPFLRSPHLCAASNCMISLCERNHLRMVNVHPAELVR